MIKMIASIIKNSWNFDGMFLRGQPAAKEGVLPYPKGGKLKRWQDLAMNAGRIVPVLDEHPDPENGNFGLYSGKEKIWGYGYIRLDEINKRLLIDIYLFDGAPVKRGYSIGYPYYGLEENGDYNGEKYTEIQSNLIVDHLALTDYPRDSHALQVLADTKIMIRKPATCNQLADFSIQDARDRKITACSADSITVVNINAIGYDSISITNYDEHAGIMQIAKKLREDNPDANDEELLERATMMFLNQKKLQRDDTNMSALNNDQEGMPEEEKDQEEEGKKKKKSSNSDSANLLTENAELKAKLAQLDSLRATELENKQLKARLAQKDALLEEFHNRELKADMDTMIMTYGADEKDFDGKSPDFVRGALWWAKNVATEDPKTGKPVEAGKDSNTPVPRDYSKLRYSLDEGKYIPQEEWKP